MRRTHIMKSNVMATMKSRLPFQQLATPLFVPMLVMVFLIIPFPAAHGIAGLGASDLGGPALAHLSPDPNPGPRPTYLTISFMPSKVDIGTHPPGTVSITATISPGGAGLLISISFGTFPSGPWTLISAGSTDASGNYTVTWSPPATGTYYFKADFEGNIDYLSSSATSGPSSMVAVPELPLGAFGVTVLLTIAITEIRSRRFRKRAV